MCDFWLDLDGLMDYFDGYCGILCICFRGGGKAKVLGFEVLGLLSYVGYVVDGWDYDYECSGRGLRYTVGSVYYDNVYVKNSNGVIINACEVRAVDSVVDVCGSLYAVEYRFRGVGATRWVLPLDLLLYWHDLIDDDLCVIANGCSSMGGNGSYFDLTAVDNEGVDVTRLFAFLFLEMDIYCYGCDYTRWLLEEFRGDGVKGLFSKLQCSFFADSFALNWDFVTSICSPGDLELLRLHLPVLFP